MSFFPYSFETVITKLAIGNGARTVTYTVVLLPDEIRSDLPLQSHPRLRVDGEIANHPFNGAWQPAGGGAYYLMVPKDILREASLTIGSPVDVRFKIADQSHVDLPDALAGALEADPQLMRLWAALTPGKQRGFAYRVASAKTDATIHKRVDEVAHMVREGLSYGKGGGVTAVGGRKRVRR